MQRLFARKDISDFLHMSMHRKTSVICTVGLNNSVEQIGSLVSAGMNIMRLNCSHGDHTHHQKSIDNLRAHVKTLTQRRIVASMLDIRGPKIRTGLLEDSHYDYEPNDEFQIRVIPTKEIPNYFGKREQIYCDYLSLATTVSVGQKILIDDGMLEVIVVAISDEGVTVRVLNKATLCERKGVLIPGAKIDLPAVSEKDKEDIKFAIRNNIDFIAASFIRKASQIREVRNILGWEGRSIGIVAKVENQEGLDNIDEIIREADAVMVARGDLGTELAPEKIFSAQKSIITKCNIQGKPVITATQMLESMTHYPSPTRAECTDVANAILDGSDCVMLSGETAKGKYPQLAVRTMHNICKEAEESIDYERLYDDIKDWYQYCICSSVRPLPEMEIVASSAVHIAYEMRAKLIVVFSDTGSTTRYLAKYKPIMPIISISTNRKLLQKECMKRGVIPHFMTEEDHLRPMEDLIKETFHHFRTHKFITSSGGDRSHVVCIFGEKNDHLSVVSSCIKIFSIRD